MRAAGLLDILAACHGAAHAVHSNRLKSRHSLGAFLDDLGNEGVTCEFHIVNLREKIVNKNDFRLLY